MRMFVRAPFFVCQNSERVTCDPAGTMAKGPTREKNQPNKRFEIKWLGLTHVKHLYWNLLHVKVEQLR